MEACVASTNREGGVALDKAEKLAVVRATEDAALVGSDKFAGVELTVAAALGPEAKFSWVWNLLEDLLVGLLLFMGVADAVSTASNRDSRLMIEKN